MAPRVVFLTLDQIIAIHAEVLLVAGGEPGILKPDALESAMASPRATYAGQHLNAFPFEMAASYLVGFTQNHAFVDGNKRVAAVAAIVFLRLNGYRLRVSNRDLSDLVLAVAKGELKKPAVADRLRAGSIKAPRR